MHPKLQTISLINTAHIDDLEKSRTETIRIEIGCVGLYERATLRSHHEDSLQNRYQRIAVSEAGLKILADNAIKRVHPHEQITNFVVPLELIFEDLDRSKSLLTRGTAATSVRYKPH